MRRWCVLLILLVLGGSCTSTRGRIVYDRHRPEGYEKMLQEGVIRILEVRVSRSLDTEKIEENSRYILNLLFLKRNEGKAGALPLSLKVSLKEDSFIRDYRIWNTVTVELSIFDGPIPVFTGLYTEETESTLSSYPYLFSLLERATREVR